jgi:hypothetical protein
MTLTRAMTCSSAVPADGPAEAEGQLVTSGTASTGIEVLVTATEVLVSGAAEGTATKLVVVLVDAGCAKAGRDREGAVPWSATPWNREGAVPRGVVVDGG